jgi:hypothetical protein
MQQLRTPAIALLAAVALSAFARPSSAATLWDESSNGDLSNLQGTPTPLALSQGVDSIIGTVNGTSDSQDFVSFVVPVGLFLNSITLSSYSSTDGRAFTGVQVGTSFVGNPLVAGSYAGYAHFGTGATNGAVVGADVLAIMANPTLAIGATGLTIPLGAGTYTFLIQQLGAATSYRFDYQVVPEPASSLLTAGGLALLTWWRRRPGAAAR